MRTRIALIACLLLGLVGLGLRSPVRHRFTVTNESGQAVQDLEVRVGPDTFQYESIPPSGAESASFRFDNEATFLLRGRLADGTEFEDFAGYVVWEDLLVRSDIVIRPGGKVVYSEWRFP